MYLNLSIIIILLLPCFSVAFDGKKDESTFGLRLEKNWRMTLSLQNGESITGQVISEDKDNYFLKNPAFEEELKIPKQVVVTSVYKIEESVLKGIIKVFEGPSNSHKMKILRCLRSFIRETSTKKFEVAMAILGKFSLIVEPEPEIKGMTSEEITVLLNNLDGTISEIDNAMNELSLRPEQVLPQIFKTFSTQKTTVQQKYLQLCEDYLRYSKVVHDKTRIFLKDLKKNKTLKSQVEKILTLYELELLYRDAGDVFKKLNFSNLKKIKELNIYTKKLPASFNELKIFPQNITTLNWHAIIDDTELEKLKKFPNLQNLYIGYPVLDQDFTSEGFKNILKLNKLKKLTLICPVKVKSEELKKLKSLTGLVDLRLVDSKINDDVLRNLAELKNLEVLSVKRHPLLTGKGFTFFKDHKKLTKLNIAMGKFKDIKSLAQIKPLKVLDLRRTGITQEHFKGINVNPQLKVFLGESFRKEFDDIDIEAEGGIQILLFNKPTEYIAFPLEK